MISFNKTESDNLHHFSTDKKVILRKQNATNENGFLLQLKEKIKREKK